MSKIQTISGMLAGAFLIYRGNRFNLGRPLK